MKTATITISGPGGVISYEAWLVIQALRNSPAGLIVTVDDSHPATGEAMNQAAWDAWRALRQEPREVHVIVEHQPWGG